MLGELAGRGYRTLKEAARHVIETEVAAGRDFKELRANAADFQHEVLRLKLQWETELPIDEVVFLDRGIPDSLAYYRHEGIVEDKELGDALERSRYRRVFILDLISRDNFTHDGARSETWEGACELDRLLEEAYRGLGYDVVRLPVVSALARADAIVARL